MYKGKAIRKYILSKLLNANLNDKFCFLVFLKRLLIFRKFQLQVSHYIQINRDSSLMVHLIILRILVTSETGI